MTAMPRTLREAWAGHITPDDYERHMAATGQPQANADLLAELFRNAPPAPGARILFAGAGTGQYFDHWAPTALAVYKCVFTDINPLFLDRLAGRLVCQTLLDDIEAPRVAGPFDLAIAILVLEHVDWRRAVAALCGMALRVFTVTQENPADLAVHPLPGTLAALRDLPTHLVDSGELMAEFGGLGFELTRASTREVRDGKKMVGLDFRRRP
jgi:SAM-dependent methyltransferase